MLAAAPLDGELLAALARLGPRDREALLLAAWEGLQGAELAAALGCSAAAAKVRLHRARRRLAAELDGPKVRPRSSEVIS